MTGTPRSYFEELYGRDDDPWGFATSFYETRKYAVTVACLPEDHYQSAFEPGCSIGVLTERLAGRCDTLLAVDLMEGVVGSARSRTARWAGVTVERRTLPDEWPDGPFDLLVLSELCYYFDEPVLRGMLATATRSLRPGATVVAVHWRGPTDYPLTGDQAHRVLAETAGLDRVVQHWEETFALDVWRYEG